MKYLLLVAIATIVFMSGATYGEYAVYSKLKSKEIQETAKEIVKWAGTDRVHTVVHRCSDYTHETCDGTCECDGMECDDSGYMHDYQIELHMDTLWLFDDARLLGKHINTDSNMYVHGEWLDSVIFKDNL